jgi:hypothetical protein
VVALSVSLSLPCSVCVAASTWQDYKAGILRNNCPFAYEALDHCVQLVVRRILCPEGDLPICQGYHTDPLRGAYWIVKNQWGTNWVRVHVAAIVTYRVWLLQGVRGYIFIAKGKNLCGIADEATLVRVRKR